MSNLSRPSRKRLNRAIATWTLLLASSGAVRAETCPDLTDAAVVVGSTAIRPLLEQLGALLAATEDRPLYYAGGGSCFGVEAVLSQEVPEVEELVYWDSGGREHSCTLDEGVAIPAVSLGVSDVFASTCVSLPNGLPSNLADILGPVQVMTLAVPQASSQALISAEAAYYVFGFGQDSGVAPWENESLIFQRSASSGTQQMIAAAIGVPAARWQGTKTTGSSDLLQQLLSVSAEQAEQTIGILSAAHVAEHRASLRILAYQDFGTECAVLPNRTKLSNEKLHVREGLYPIWGPLHLLTPVDNSRKPTNPLIATLIAYLTGTEVPPVGLDLIYLQAQYHLVPQCAMSVTRTRELGKPNPFYPPNPCGCYYEAAANGETACAACEAQNDCSQDEVCSYGFCESTTESQ